MFRSRGLENILFAVDTPVVFADVKIMNSSATMYVVVHP